jgi:hypothetical protein
MSDHNNNVIKLNELDNITKIMFAAKSVYDSFVTPTPDPEDDRKNLNTRFEIGWGTPCGALNIGATFEPNEKLIARPIRKKKITRADGNATNCSKNAN